MDDGSGTLVGLNGQLNTLIDDMEAAMKPVLSTWEGDAMTTYVQRKTEWDSATNELTELALKFGKVVDESKQLHQTTNQKIIDSLS
jgi:WXG100 family type VII secretion target